MLGARGRDPECVSVGAAVAEDLTPFKRETVERTSESPWKKVRFIRLNCTTDPAGPRWEWIFPSTKAVIMMWVVVALVAVLMMRAGAARKLVPGKLQNMAEMLVDFIRGIILDTMGKDGMRFFPLIATLFLFILFCNLIGLIPGSLYRDEPDYRDGRVRRVVYGLSLVMGFSLHGIKFLGILVPPGTPGWLLPLMIPIELISQLARPISSGRAAVCEYDGRPCHSRGPVRTGHQRRIADWLVAVCVHDCDERIGSRHCVYSSLYFYRLDLCLFGRRIPFARP